MKRTALMGFALLALLPTADAQAGRLIATGHDTDHHCGRRDAEKRFLQCHFFRTAVDYLRAGAPDPGKPVLALDRGPLDVVESLDRAYGIGVVPRTVMDPRSPQFKNAPITTDLYSAVIVASSMGETTDPTKQDLNELNGTPDSDAINARAADLRAFFDSGGGLLVNSGNTHGDGPDDPYYAFLPLTVRGSSVTEPFTLTDGGRSLGFAEGDVTCCRTHNTFEPPSAGVPIRAIDIDGAGKIVSMFAEARRYSSLAEAPITSNEAKQIESGVPRSTGDGCTRKRYITMTLRRPRGRRFSTVTIYVNGERVRRLLGRRIRRKIRIVRPKTYLARVRLVIMTTGKRKIVVRRTYKRCRWG